MANRWLAIYSKPRWEKKVAHLLMQKGYEVYCPLNKVQRKWSDRYKIVLEPLFKSYVFVKTDEASRSEVRMTPGVVNFVYTAGKPAVIREKEINIIKQFLNDYEHVEAVQTILQPNQRVTITKGLFMDNEGSVLSVEKNYAKVTVDSLGFTLIAKFAKKNLKPTKQHHTQ